MLDQHQRASKASGRIAHPDFYRPLNTDRAEIRVLQLENTPGIVRCHLERVSLNDARPGFAQYIKSTKRKQKRKWVSECARNCLCDHQKCAGLVFPRWRLTCDNLEWEELVTMMRLNSVKDDPLLQKQHRILQSVRISAGKDAESSPTETFCIDPRFCWGDFEAISYCWESEVKDHEVFLNGYLTKVPQSLETALRRVRELPEVQSGMRIWCDALCIDQNNTSEKNHQVGMMSRIFRSAFSVLVWLGPESDHSATAIGAVIQNDYLHRNYESSPWDTRDDENWITRLPWMPMMMLFQRSFWQRLWIVQELALNHNMTLFLCGGDQFSRGMIHTAAEAACNHATLISRQIGKTVLGDQTQRLFSDGTAPGFSHQDTFAMASRVRSLVTLGKSSDQKRLNNLASIISIGRKAMCKDPRDKVYGLLGLLPENVSREIAPDYHKLKSEIYMDFAQTLMLNGGLTLLLSWCYASPDSRLPSWVPDWTIDVSRHHVQWLGKRRAGGQYEYSGGFQNTSQGQLRCKVVIFDRIHKSSKSLAECPSFRTIAGRRDREPVSSGERSRHHSFNRYGTHAGISEALQRTLIMDHPKQSHPPTLIRSRYHRKHFTLFGNIFWVNWDFFSTDRTGNRPFAVCSCTETISDQEISSKVEFCFNTMQAIAKDPMWKTFDRFRHSNADFDIFGHPLSAFFPSIFEHRANCPETPTMTQEDDSQQDEVQDQQEVEIDSQTAPLQEKPFLLTNEDEQNVMYAVLTLDGRRLVTTRTGYVGLLPENANDEDVIAVIRGCNFPVVLRPVVGVPQSRSNSPQLYKYVGECYIDGIMDGEIIEAVARGELSEEDVALV